MQKKRDYGRVGIGRLERLTVCVLLVSVCFLAACGGSQGDDYTPPPATIIRSTDQQIATPPPGQAQPAATSQPGPPVQSEQLPSPYPYPTSSGARGPTAAPPLGIYPSPPAK